MNIMKRNNIHICGKGQQTLLLAHGFGCDQRMWKHILPVFEENFRVVLFDYVGSGKSDPEAYYPLRYSALDGYAKDILEICEALNLKDVIFIGHSVSSMIGALASIEQPHYFEKLVMLVPSPRYLNDGDEYIGGFEESTVDELMHQMAGDFVAWASRFAPYLLKNDSLAYLGEEIRETFCSMNTEIAKRFARATFYADNREELKQISIPTLILQCVDDPIVPRRVGEYLKENIAESTLKILQISGHFPQVTHPALTSRAILDYISPSVSSVV